MNEQGWIEHDGDKCPVPADTVVHVRFRDGVDCHDGSTAGYWDGFGQEGGSCWQHSGDEPCSDIIAYRIVEPGK